MVRRCPERVLRIASENGVGERIVDQLGEAMARLHSIDPAAAPATIARPEGAGPIETGVTIIDTHLELLTEPSPVFGYAARWLERNMPPEPGDLAVVHSDIRNGNIIVGDDGLRAILDWEGTRVGDPMEDLAWPCQRMWRFREEARTVGGFAGVDVLRAAYERRAVSGTSRVSIGGGCTEPSSGDSAWRARRELISTEVSVRS